LPRSHLDFVKCYRAWPRAYVAPKLGTVIPPP
jgi:hypothetical protein